MLIVLVGYLCVPCMLYNGTCLTVGIFVCRVCCITAHTWHEVQGQPRICSHQTSIYSSFSRICAILLAGLWNEILDGEHVHPIRCLRVFLAFAPSKWKDKFAFFWCVLDLFTTFCLGRMNEWVLIATCKQFVWSTRIGRNMPIGLHLHHIGLRHYSLSHLIKVPRVRKHISK